MTAALKRAWLSLLFLAVALLLFIMTFSLNPTARLVPMAVAVPTAAILLLQACLDLFPALSGTMARYSRLSLRNVEALRARGIAMSPREPGTLGAVMAWFSAAPLLISLLGFTLAAPLYTIAFLRFRASETWITSIAVGIGISLVVALLLTLAAGKSTFGGLLITWALGA